MAVTKTYRPSDVEAVKILNQIKAKLGISGRIDTVEERRKAYYYLKGKGWNMSMLACNPDYIHDPERKALCMLFNELRGEEMKETVKGNEEQLKKYGSAFRKTYERNKRIIEVQKNAIESASKGSGVRELQEVEKNTGIKTVPKPEPKPTIVARKVPTNSVPQTVHVTSVQKRGIDVKKVGLGLLGLAVLYYVLRRR